MKGIQERIAEKYPDHSQIEWDVLNGIVAIAKVYAGEVSVETLKKACVRVPEDYAFKVLSTEILTP